MNLGKETVNNNQIRALMVCTTWPTVINYGSGMLARKVGRDIWISGIISIISTLILILIMVYIGRNFPGKTVIEYGEALLWKFPGKLLGLILAVYFLFATVNTISMYIHHLTDFLLPETPFLVVTIIHVAVITYLVWKGPEVIARMGVIGFTLAIIFHFLVFLASLSEIDFSRLMPIAETGFLEVGKSSFCADSFIGINQLIVGMILPMAVNQNKAYSTTSTGLLIGGAFFVFYFTVELMVMGPQVVALMRIASMDFVRSIQITQYLHRFESFMVGLWYWSILVQAGILFFCSLKAFLQTLNIKKENPKKVFIIVLGFICILLTYYISNDRVFFLNYREYTWQYISIPIQYGLPLILLAMLFLKKVLNTNSKKNKC